MADKFEDLRTYTTVVKCGGINAAASELGIAKSAVSRRISDLEARLGVSLIERTTRKFELTAVGREYFRRAGTILDSLELLDGDPAGTASRDEISIAAQHDVHTSVLAPALASFLLSHPGVRLRLLGAGEDADLELTTSPADGRETQPVKSFEHVLSVAPAYLDARGGGPSAVTDLDEHVAILVRDGRTTGWTFRGGASRRPKNVVEAEDADVAAALALAGLGIAQLPDYLVEDHIRDGRLIALLSDDAPSPTMLSACFAADAGISVKALADHLTKSSSRTV